MDSCRRLDFRSDQEPESIFQIRAVAGVNIKVYAGSNEKF